jgi:hypothetical protein
MLTMLVAAADERADERILLLGVGSGAPHLRTKPSAVVVRMMAGYALHAA